MKIQIIIQLLDFNAVCTSDHLQIFMKFTNVILGFARIISDCPLSRNECLKANIKADCSLNPLYQQKIRKIWSFHYNDNYCYDKVAY